MRKFLLYSSALVLGLSGAAQSACIQTPTCSSLGYTSSSSCSGGTKCPFGNYWNCTASDLNNKITNLETQITELKKEVTTSVCIEGDILYSDMTCNPNYIASKTPIGVVFDHGRKLAIGLSEVRRSWSDSRYALDVPGVSNITDKTKVLQDMDGKKNTSAVLAYCRAMVTGCPAVEYANRYETEGTKAGDWYLPSMGELYVIYSNMSVLNETLKKVGTEFAAGIVYDYWSSSEYSGSDAWELYTVKGVVVNQNKYSKEYYVRPVLAF